VEDKELVEVDALPRSEFGCLPLEGREDLKDFRNRGKW
jgi:hypothetical protein